MKRYSLSDPAHPIWPLLTILIVGLLTLAALKTTTHEFNAQDWRAFGGVLSCLTGWKSLSYYLTHREQSTSPQHHPKRRSRRDKA